VKGWAAFGDKGFKPTTTSGRPNSKVAPATRPPWRLPFGGEVLGYHAAGYEAAPVYRQD
jgi:hypothetical protein